MKTPKTIKGSSDVRDSLTQAVLNTDKAAHNKRMVEKNNQENSRNSLIRISRLEVQISRLIRRVDELTKSANNQEKD